MTLSGGAGDPLAGPRAAVAEARWDEALELLEVNEARGSAEGLELRAQAAYGAGDPEQSVSAWEDLYALQTAGGDDLAAAHAAAMVAMYLMIDTGLMAPIRGWLRRAERLTAGYDETPVHAMVAMVSTYERLWCGDMEAAEAHAARAIDLGTRLGVEPAVLIGRLASGRLAIFAGDISGGLEILDDVALLLTSGVVDAMTSGMAFCELICAVQGLSMFDRAAEWTQAMEHWRHGTAFGGFHGRCRVHRAEMLRLTGPCDEAEEEALEACEELRPWMRREFGWPLTELGNIRLRKGDLAGAEEAFLAAHGNSWSPQPGLALLLLEQGDVAGASTLIAEAIANPFDIPSKERPPFGPLRTAPLLDAQVEIAVAAGDIETARRGAEELSGIADSFGIPALIAGAALARGRVALAAEDVRGAIDHCERAVDTWVGVGAPFEAAVARMVLGQARSLAGNQPGALVEWRAAHRSFEEFGASRWAERVAAAVEKGFPLSPSEPPRADEPSLFRCEGDTRTIRFDGTQVLVRDLKGLRYLERLLAEPNREFHVLDLVAVERGSLPTIPTSHEPGLDTTGGHAGLHLDDEAREAYRRRLADIDEDIEDATRMNDLGRLERAQHDRAYLIAELSRAVGLGGRGRLAAATAERARTSVTRALRYAMTRIEEHHSGLGHHLAVCVATGTYCVYQPDPRLPVSWEV